MCFENALNKKYIFHRIKLIILFILIKFSYWTASGNLHTTGQDEGVTFILKIENKAVGVITMLPEVINLSLSVFYFPARIY